MKSGERTTLKPGQPAAVEKDGETPVPLKPSFLFLVAMAIGVITLIVLVISAYHGITH